MTPWTSLAYKVGARIKWWTITNTANNNADDVEPSCILSDLVTERTRVVAISHVSNIIGMERNISSICNLVRHITKGRGQVVVDGVAAAPHFLSAEAIASGQPDWYVVSLHKMFGPHLGCLIGRRQAMEQLHCSDEGTVSLSDEDLCKSWEMGTMNYEACCGAIGLKKYFDTIGNGKGVSSQTSYQLTAESTDGHLDGQILSQQNTSYSCKNGKNVLRKCIHQLENQLIHRQLGYLQERPRVRIIQDTEHMRVTPCDTQHHETSLQRIPIVCFVHANIPSHTIVEHCRKYGVICRAGKFLSTTRLWKDLGLEADVSVVRFSLAHYNTREEIDESIRVLEMLDGW